MTEPNKKQPDTEPQNLDENTTAGQPTAPEAQPAGPADAKAAKGAKKPKGDAAKIAALEEKLADAGTKLDTAGEAYKRLAAEYDNFRKRSQKEHDTAFSNGMAHAAEQLLPLLDTVDAAAAAESTDEEYKKGVLMIQTKAKEIFAKLGIEEIDADGQPFDPELHNACMQEDGGDVESGHITRVMQRGYTLNGRVIRHAVVAVAQ